MSRQISRRPIPALLGMALVLVLGFAAVASAAAISWRTEKGVAL